ncbi:MAG: polysaccharide deacetylase family protein [Candidatus Omnitrophota bacterium]|jgi:peptidoglycan/xylan/chitin deacetylase (PgdA/CDA1 family)
MTKGRRRLIIFTAAAALFIALALWIKAQYVVPVIMYHKISGTGAESRLNVSPESFKRQMRFLKDHNYNIVSLEGLEELVKKNNFPNKTIAVTFDDGYEDNYLNAYPVLKELDIPATIFIAPALIGTDGYLSWDQVREMSGSGIITIGSHTMSHIWLPGQAEQKLDSEIRDSKRSIEGHIGSGINTFSYPLGGFDKNVRKKVIEAGYKIAAATNPGKKYPRHDLFAMKRLRISRSSDNLAVFWFETSGFYTWIKEHRDED